MIFAEDEESFYRYHEEMRARLSALDYEQVYERDLADAIAQDEARKRALSGNTDQE